MARDHIQMVPQFSQQMLATLDNIKVKCVKRGDQGFPVEINGTPKLCKFERRQMLEVTCDYNAFLDKKTIDDDKQYGQIIHEVASSLGFEPPDGDISEYTVSKQIVADYLEFRQVKMLSIHKKRKVTDIYRRHLPSLELPSNASTLQCAQEITKARISSSEMSDLAPANFTPVWPLFGSRYFTFTAVDKAKNSFTGWVYVSLQNKYHEDLRTGSRTDYKLCELAETCHGTVFSLSNSSGTEVDMAYNCTTSWSPGGRL